MCSTHSIPSYFGPRPSRDEVYLRMAEIFATRGTCPRRQVGCLITNVHGDIIAEGYNGVAAGRPHCSEGHPCPGVGFPSGQGLDKCEAIHAEQNAILKLRDPRAAHTVYVTAFPCHSCIKLLMGTSAQRIVFRHDYPHSESKRWWAEQGREILHLPAPEPGVDGLRTPLGITYHPPR